MGLHFLHRTALSALLEPISLPLEGAIYHFSLLTFFCQLSLFFILYIYVQPLLFDCHYSILPLKYQNIREIEGYCGDYGGQIMMITATLS